MESSPSGSSVVPKSSPFMNAGSAQGPATRIYPEIGDVISHTQTLIILYD
jgi:hypothetical protein